MTVNPEAPKPSTRRRKAWSLEADEEVAALLRLLANKPWLIAGRDDEDIAAVRRHEGAIRDAVGRLGWKIHIEKDLVRLGKKPPARLDAWAPPASERLACTWFFLLVAAAESMTPRTGLHSLVNGARACAAEAGLPTDGSLPERRAILKAMRWLIDRGIIEQLDGNIDAFESGDERTEVALIAVHHSRLSHVIANSDPTSPAEDPERWLAHVGTARDVGRRMRSRLIDDAVVHLSDLDPEESEWLKRRVKDESGARTAAAFGLVVERRAEGAAFVLPDHSYGRGRELGTNPFPATGTVPHAALLLCAAADDEGIAPEDAAGAPGEGWRGLRRSVVLSRLLGWASPSWSAEMAEDPALLAGRVFDLLGARDLVRQGAGGDPIWWFSPATARWRPPAGSLRVRPRPPAAVRAAPPIVEPAPLRGRRRSPEPETADALFDIHIPEDKP